MLPFQQLPFESRASLATIFPRTNFQLSYPISYIAKILAPIESADGKPADLGRERVGNKEMAETRLRLYISLFVDFFFFKHPARRTVGCTSTRIFIYITFLCK